MRRDAIISARFTGSATTDRTPVDGEICVFLSKYGYAAEYKVGRTKFRVPVTGRDPLDTLNNARKWLKAPIGKR